MFGVVRQPFLGELGLSGLRGLSDKPTCVKLVQCDLFRDFPEKSSASAAIMANGKKPEAKGSANDRREIGQGFSNKEVDAAIAKALAASEKERMAKAKLIAAEIQRKAILTAGRQDGGPLGAVGTLPNETPELLKNMCGILNRGFANLGSDMKSLKSSFSTRLNALTDSVESNFSDMWADYGGEDDDMSVDGSEAEPPPPAPFRPEHELSDEEEEEETPRAAGVQDQIPEVGLANLSQDNYFARLARALRTPSNVGDNLDVHLAELVNHVFEHPLPVEEFIRQKEGTLRPGNCTQLQVPPVPEAIWIKVSGELKGRDKAAQKLHGDFLCFVFRVLKCLNKFHSLVDSCPELQTPVEEMTDALRLAGYIHRIGFIEARREALKPDLPGEFKRLAGTNFPPCPSSLFGENLVENVKSISEVARLSDKMAAAGKTKTGPQQQRGRYHPYARGRSASFR